MIDGFENQTAPLTPDEMQIMNKVIHGFKHHIGKENAIKGREIIRLMREKGYKIDGPRLRKIISYIRINGIMPICSSASGYWCSVNVSEIQTEIKSLNDRAAAIASAARGLKKFVP